MHRIAISTECVADLPQEMLKKYNIEIIYYNIRTEMGLFRDTDEITSINIIEYMVGGQKKAQSVVPDAREYKLYFEKLLNEYDEILHICISGGISEAYSNSSLARAKMGRDGNRIRIIDSKHLSSGLGILTILAAKLRSENMSLNDIASKIEETIPRTSTSFLAYNADYLYYNGKVSKSVMEICQKLNLHPVLAMIDGKLSLKQVYIGKYDRCAMKYVKQLKRNASNIDKTVGFITYAGCKHETLDMVHAEVEKYVAFEALYEQAASATVSCNCGPNTFGVLYFTKR